MCVYAADYYNCDGVCLSDMDGDGVCDELEIVGCQDEMACNYNDAATDAADSCADADASFTRRGAPLERHRRRWRLRRVGNLGLSG